jgi:hypothetical protein
VGVPRKHNVTRGNEWLAKFVEAKHVLRRGKGREGFDMMKWTDREGIRENMQAWARERERERSFTLWIPSLWDDLDMCSTA